jgi:hypothetical protein
MKYSFFLSTLFFISNSIFCQEIANSLSMSEELSAMSKQPQLAHTMTSSAFQSYASNQVNGSQFFIANWRPGEVVLMDKERFKDGLMFSYDKVRQELFIRLKDSAAILQGIKNQIYSFSLNAADGKQYHFVNSSLFTNEDPEVFYQMLVYDSSGLSLLKYTRTNFVKADMTDIMKVKEGDIYDSFVDNYTYYIVKDHGVPETVQLKSKSLKKVFADLKIDPQKYMNDHPGTIDEDYLIDMIMQLNQ